MERLPEKGRRSLRCSLTEHRSGAFRPILASLGLPNPRSECCSYPFSDSLGRGILRSSYMRQSLSSSSHLHIDNYLCLCYPPCINEKEKVVAILKALADPLRLS